MFHDVRPSYFVNKHHFKHAPNNKIYSINHQIHLYKEINEKKCEIVIVANERNVQPFCATYCLTKNFLFNYFQGGNGNMNSSEFVRQELRAVVNSRSQQSNQSPLGGGGSGGGMGQGPMVGNNNNQMNMAQQQQMSGTPILNSTPDPTLGFNFEMAQTGKFSLLC